MEEEVQQELEAVQAVYGPDCTLLHDLPPCLQVVLKPRTADDISQQFVEAVLVIKASMQYPAEPPDLELKDTKGLDEERQRQLLMQLRAQASELNYSPMLVAICEAAIDQLTIINQPEGNCCFCMCSLVMEDAQAGLRPFMKLLSCFHCFHSDCFGRWWRWQLDQLTKEVSELKHLITHGQEEQEVAESNATSLLSQDATLEKLMQQLQVKCPVCRKGLHADDIAHVQRFLTSRSSVQQGDEEETSVPSFLLTSEELARRESFSEQFKVQQSRGGIIEPRKLEVLMPGMFLAPVASSMTISRNPSQEGEGATICTSSSASNPAVDMDRRDVGDQSLWNVNPIVSQQFSDHRQELSQVQNLNLSGKDLRGMTGEFSGHIHRGGRQPKQGRHKVNKVQWIKRERNTDR